MSVLVAVTPKKENANSPRVKSPAKVMLCARTNTEKFWFNFLSWVVVVVVSNYLAFIFLINFLK